MQGDLTPSWELAGRLARVGRARAFEAVDDTGWHADLDLASITGIAVDFDGGRADVV